MNDKWNLETGNQILSLENQPWDSQILQRQCAKVISITGDPAAPDFGPLSKELDSRKVEYVTVRLPQDERLRIQALVRAGFEVVDGIVAFARSVEDFPSVHYPEIRLAKTDDADAVAELAAHTFRFSRFHNDPAILREQADKIHYEWALNSCLGKAADAVWLWEEQGRIAGFSTISIRECSATLVLIAVADDFSGRGIAGKLTNKCCEWIRSRGISLARVQTQSHNVAAQAVYRKAGFHVENLFTTLRWARGQVPYNLGPVATEAFLHLQVIFFKELSRLADELGANIEDVWAAVAEDWRIGAKPYNPLRDPNEDESWEGLRRLLRISRQVGFDFRLLQAAAAEEDPVEYLRLKISAARRWWPAAHKN